MVSGILLLTYYKNYELFIIMSPKQLCFPFLLKMMLDFSTFSKHSEQCGSIIDPQSNKDLGIFSTLLNA